MPSSSENNVVCIEVNLEMSYGDMENYLWRQDDELLMEKKEEMEKRRRRIEWEKENELKEEEKEKMEKEEKMNEDDKYVVETTDREGDDINDKHSKDVFPLEEINPTAKSKKELLQLKFRQLKNETDVVDYNAYMSFLSSNKMKNKTSEQDLRIVDENVLERKMHSIKLLFQKWRFVRWFIDGKQLPKSCLIHSDKIEFAV